MNATLPLDLGLVNTPAAPAPATPPLDLQVARLLPLLPTLEGNEEDVSVAHLLRSACIGNVWVATQDAWAHATPEQRADPDYRRRLQRNWRERVLLLTTPTEAAWWLTNGQGSGSVATAAAAALRPCGPATD